MTHWTVIFIFSAVFVSTIVLGQTSKDSATYWVNKNYLECIDSGNAVCQCEQLNDFLILHLDTTQNILTVNPSIHYSWETFELNIKRKTKKTFTISPTSGIDSGSTFNIKTNQLILTTPEKTTEFIKIRVKRIDSKWIQGDLWRQIGVINCSPFLKYSVKLCGDSCTFPLTTKVLSENISKGQVTISCSDDYHYNEMYFNTTQTSFFLVYDSNSIKAYKMPHPRDRGEKVDISIINDCQIFYKK